MDQSYLINKEAMLRQHVIVPAIVITIRIVSFGIMMKLNKLAH